MRDWTWTRLKGKGGFDAAIIAPDIFSLDVEQETIRLTLLRGSMMACHDEKRPVLPRDVFADRGEHWFRFRFMAGKRIATTQLDEVAIGMQRPLLTASTTRGMKTKYLRGTYAPAVSI